MAKRERSQVEKKWKRIQKKKLIDRLRGSNKRNTVKEQASSENILIKDSEVASYIYFLKLLFDCPMANFGPLSRGHSYSPNVNHCVLHFRPEGYQAL